MRKLVLLLAFSLLFGCPSQDSYSVSDAGIIHFPERNCPVWEINSSLEGTDKLVGLRFENGGAVVYGLLRVPRSSAPLPALVLLHGAGVNKVYEQKLARTLSRFGYASLAIDLRGHGETGGQSAGMEDELAAFASGKPPQTHLMVSDALCAFDALAAHGEVDADRIAFAGESMGGRLALIAAALEPRAKGAVGISTAGYGLPSHRNKTIERYLRSIDPDNYLTLLPPRPVVFVHSTADQTVPYATAVRSYSLAREPRRLVTVTCPIHGYCEEMDGALAHELEKMLAAKAFPREG
ncbi:MAG: alpha/beta hydrolase [Candidatus Micrarchaeia archaeon]